MLRLQYAKFETAALRSSQKHPATSANLVWLELARHICQPADVAGGGALGRHAGHLTVRKTALRTVLNTLPLSWLPIVCLRCTVAG